MNERLVGERRRMQSWSSFALFAETLLTGVLVTCFGVLVVTAIPAVAAGASRLRRHVGGEADSIGTFVADFAAAWRALWPLAVGVPVLGGVLAANAVVVGSGAVPGGTPIAAAMACAAVTVVLVSLRGAAMWRPGRAPANRWDVAAVAARRSVADPFGSALIAIAAVMGAVLGWMFVPFAAVAPGLLALALVAVDQRGAAPVEDPGR